MRMADRIRTKIQAALAPERIEIEDDSSRHAGHAGSRPGGESHFNIRVVSESFRGLDRVARQRLVYGALASELADGVHALGIRAETPDEAKSADAGIGKGGRGPK